jgi:hypothetical protein
LIREYAQRPVLEHLSGFLGEEDFPAPLSGKEDLGFAIVGRQFELKRTLLFKELLLPGALLRHFPFFELSEGFIPLGLQGQVFLLLFLIFQAMLHHRAMRQVTSRKIYKAVPNRIASETGRTKTCVDRPADASGRRPWLVPFLL